MKLILKLSLASLAVAPLVALAQPQKKPAPAPAVVSGLVTIRNSPAGTAIYDDARGLARLTKDVVITQSDENIILYAQTATYDRIRNLARADGQLRVVTRDSTITGDVLNAKFNDRLITITGHVVINSHGKNDGAGAGLRGEATKKPVRITGDQVTWNYANHQATVTGRISISQGPNKGTCESIFYDEINNYIELRGRSYFGDDQNRTFLGRDLRVYIEKGLVNSDKPITIKFKEQAGMNGASPAPTRRPNTRVPLPPARTLPNIDEVTGPPTAPTGRAAIPDEEPLPTLPPEEPAEAPEVTPTAAPTK
jgi:lipopolysaccharide export system protein LptA